MTDHPTPGSPLSADDVGLLKRGDVVRCLAWDVVTTVDDADIEDGDVEVTLDGKGCAFPADHFTFIGRPDADGWIAWSGGENPIGGVVVEVKYRNGETEERDARSFGWNHWHDEDRPSLGGYDIIAFRLPTDRRAEADEGKKHGPKCWGRTSYSDEMAHCYCEDTPPSAGLDAGLETVAWLWESGHGDRSLMFDARHGDEQPLVTRQSAAAALEAAAEREKHLLERIETARVARVEQNRQLVTLDAQVAALREALELARSCIGVNVSWPNEDAEADLVAIDQALSSTPAPGRE